MATRQKLVSGSVLEVPLEKGFGFGYVKLVFTKDIQPKLVENLIVKVYNRFSKKPFAGPFVAEEFETDDLLVFPFLSLGLPPLRGDGSWKPIGKASLTKEDHVIPDFVFRFHFNHFIDHDKEAKSEYGIGYKREFNNNISYTHNADAVRHLGYWLHRDSDSIKQLMTLYWMKVKKADPHKFYPKDEFKKYFWLKNAWEETKHDKMIFRKMPKVKRMRAVL